MNTFAVGLDPRRAAHALNLNNHDNSDIQTAYFDAGHYVDISIGQWDKPFINTSKE